MNIPPAVLVHLSKMNQQEIKMFWEYLDSTPSYKIHQDFEMAIEDIAIEKQTESYQTFCF